MPLGIECGSIPDQAMSFEITDSALKFVKERTAEAGRPAIYVFLQRIS
jgi:hypothetical protein